MYLYCADSRENNNALHFDRVMKFDDVQPLRGLLPAASLDHTGHKFKDGYRNNANFESCDCIILDVDNDKSEDPDEWMTTDDFGEVLEENGILAYYVYSRHNMKEKIRGDIHFAPRPKFHVYFPLSKEITSALDLKRLKLEIIALLPLFDEAAIDPGRFFFGVKDPQGGELSEGLPVDAVMDPARGYLEQVRKTQRANCRRYIDKVQAGEWEAYKRAEVVNCIYDRAGLAAPISQTPTPAAPGADPYERAEQIKKALWVKNWAQAYGVPITGEHTAASTGIMYLDTVCPWEDQHTTDDTSDKVHAIAIGIDGKLGYNCFHAHCINKSWRQFRDAYQARKLESTMTTAGDQTTPETAAAADNQETAPDDLEKMFSDIEAGKFIPAKTGLAFFDDLLGGGVVRQTLSIIQAQPAAGKTTFCQQLGRSLARQGEQVIYMNFEMSKEQLIAKDLSAYSFKYFLPIGLTEILQGQFWKTNREFEESLRASVEKYRAEVYPNLRYNPDNCQPILEDIELYLQKIGGAAKQAGRRGPIVIVDYLHLITSRQKLDTADLLKKAVVVFKNYAVEYNTFVIAIAATNREANKSGVQSMSSIRDSSNVEYTADYQISLGLSALSGYRGKRSAEEIIEDLNDNDYKTVMFKLHKSRYCRPNRYRIQWFNSAYSIYFNNDEMSSIKNVNSAEIRRARAKNEALRHATETSESEDPSAAAFNVKDFLNGAIE